MNVEGDILQCIMIKKIYGVQIQLIWALLYIMIINVLDAS